MTDRPELPAMTVERFIPPAPGVVVSPLLRMPLRLSDRVLVMPGDTIEPGQPLVERFREEEVVDVSTDAALIVLQPGDPVDQALAARRDRRAVGLGGRARVVGHGRDGRTRLAMGRHDIAVLSPIAGHAEAVLPARLDLRAEGLGIEGAVAFGRPVHGRIQVAASGPGTELRSSAIDVGAAGALLVVGARMDIEAVSRARAIGVSGIISGGMVGRELRQLEEAEARQRAALHPAAPFALLALGGYGRRPIPVHLWDLLVAAEGRPAGILPETRTLVIGGDPDPLLDAAERPAGSVAVMAGEHAGREGRVVGLAGARRWQGGSYGPGAFIELVGTTGLIERLCLPLSDLERLG